MRFVHHPRYGNEPRETGLNPQKADAGVHLHWHNENSESYSWSRSSKTVPNTAVLANPKEQDHALYPVTHYFDLERVCLDCKQPFLFFAEEQQFWYEHHKFPLDADCVRCVPCRLSMRTLQKFRFRYEELQGIENLSEDLEHELAETRLVLIEEAVFSMKQADAIRAFFNRFPEHNQIEAMRTRLQAISLEHS